MSSPDNKDYGDLEQAMWRRFQDAEAMPDPEVWSRIDHALAMQDNEKYKKRALFYRQLAAACFILFVLSGSALVLHFKQDQEQELLASAEQPQPQTKAPIAGNATINSTPTTEAAQPSGNYTLPKAEEGTIAANAQVPSTNYSYAEPEEEATLFSRNSKASNKSVQNNAGQNYTTVAATTATMATQPGVYSAGQLAATTANNAVPSVTGSQVQGYMPASQAIAVVPDTYTSPTVLNPLLRRNATLGSIAAGGNVPESAVQQKQDELLLALNKPTESETAEKATKNSRWNVGMGVASSYFTQNVDIPEQYLAASDGRPGIMRHTGPIVSVETAENLVNAYKEFEDNTQAANAINVDAKAGFRLNKRFKVLAGLGYSKNTSKTRTSYIVEQFLFNPRNNERSKLKPTTVFLPSLHTFTTDSVSVIKTKEPFNVDYSYQMLSVPLEVQVEGAIGQKWFWYAHGGGAANVIMQSTIKADNPEIADVSYGPGDDSPFRKVQFSGNAGLGLGKRLTDAVSISFGPEYRHFFSSLLASEYANAKQGKPYTIGVNMGINYMLGQAGK
ncbi:hypothetical protein [Pontibacter fetidus]|uniref:Outer membrane protein beta-barrel domain-containing protein n=1 Tax=Pontibacter fetidus TaxID=2700082 RepID=A0A6B2H185_9BACT|nr:hypothetical protein [Pontibacter fetidus]NDK56101.1 hypothetical protein [Pontibacter fetidus]